MSDNCLTLNLPYVYKNETLKCIDFGNTFFMYYPILELCKVVESEDFTDY